MNPTAQQITEAQQAGDTAYATARANGGHPTECYDVYRAAYDAKRDEQEHAKSMVKHASGAIETANGLAELTDDEIALMEARCSDDVKWTHYNSATEGA